MTTDDPEFAAYVNNWPGSPHTERIGAEAAAAPRPVPPIEIPDDEPVEETFETPKDFLHTLDPESSLWAENQVRLMLESSQVAIKEAKTYIISLAQVFATLAVARSMREHTASLSAPPKSYKMNTATGKIEEL